MKTIPKIDRERLGQLLPGALLKLGSQIVTFDGYRDDVDYQLIRREIFRTTT
ncbi:hypothetical protein [Serratia sp. Ag1]|uniref:hypothetical protein n=1 Tax=Serratia sp. Ag1 TaxID=1524467 RepID=UPI001376BD5B|nr:hypothetical protein [Serratia sp. Ag1]